MKANIHPGIIELNSGGRQSEKLIAISADINDTSQEKAPRQLLTLRLLNHAVLDHDGGQLEADFRCSIFVDVIRATDGQPDNDLP